MISLFQDAFCRYVKERYIKVYEHEHDLNTVDIKKKVDDVIAPLKQTRFFYEQGSS